MFLDQLANGVVLGTIIALTAVGLSLIFGVTGLVNFAHGDLLTLGAVFALVFTVPSDVDPGGIGLPFWLSVILAVALGGVVGGLLERGLFRPLRERNVGGIALLIITIGLALVVRHVILLWIGGQGFGYGLELQRRESFLGLNMTPRDVMIVLISVAVMAWVGLFLMRSRTGKAMRALADNPDLAEASGIDVNRVIMLTWVMGGAVGALGGIFLGMTEQVRYTMGFNLLLLIFAAVILGGIGTAFGAMLGGLIIGVVTQVSTLLPVIETNTDLKLAVALGIMVIVLLIRPQGILGKKERVS
ncbi:MAG: branched-chain amino acid ABC transporter permease [Acidimicrobiia bacterium]|nr:branched-chain amino acid ABC transporter permease [Acidimicrobiia bacterium]MBT8194068.1 branched-chain amino acid ABC transporter permease [Acidimicrobiia bacterium]MBT8247147.1 branched-chain amino acid ABC transporter permease [Acidimicrobiia bacterium]NNF88111.1 branched-chain amino acid ABC transporter permease [Acidimicrobiia bacterium]NNL12858.1 branched-chain amino acid ABC transporter permease [Acidimicrobiia bacterium]